MTNTNDDINQLRKQIIELAQTPSLLVACDFDGTIAPIVEDPMQSKPHRESSTALRNLAGQVNTSVSIISGRSLRDLAALSRFPEEIMLVGSHGSEFDINFGKQLSNEEQALIHEANAQVQVIAEQYDARVESKPASVAFHFRQLDPAVKSEAKKKILDGPGKLKGINIKQGHEVIELSVVTTNKGNALESIRQTVNATAVLFVGDDITDEDAFTTLKGPDVGIKVGTEDTQAAHRVSSPDEVSQILALLAEKRQEWLKGAGLVPINDHSIISDLRTAAIITPNARITWLCTPRIDSSAVFAELVGGEPAGFFAVKDPEGNAPISQAYIEDTMLLKTDFTDFSVTDYMDCSRGVTTRLAGRSDIIRTLEGSGEAIIEFSPRLNFARSHTTLQIKDEGLLIKGTNDLMVLRSEGVSWEIINQGSNQTAIGKVVLESGKPVHLELRSGTATLQPDSLTIDERRQETEQFWRNWTSKLELPEVETAQVKRSALILKSLCHGPTGAILAAATSSLPEHLGGVRNWDYRYCWLRDASLTARSLVKLGSNSEAMSFIDWVLGLLDGNVKPERLSPLYNVAGRHLPPEAELSNMTGYGGSRPVRIGNAADGQIQLDVFGPVIDLIYVLQQSGEPLSGEHWKLVEAMVEAVKNRWQEPDHGIWEIRKPPKHHVYSKLMGWVTVDRAIKISQQFVDETQEAWIKLRDQIAKDIFDNGWNEELKSFTAAYESTELDSSVLAVGLWGLVEPSDPRFVGTVAAVEKGLKEGATVYRYLEDDGLPGKEGGFNLTTSWLIDSMWLSGRKEDAKNLFAELVQLIGQTGLMAEQLDPVENMALGNVPQAYSHLGLIDNALLLNT